jgi:hypothetical protein
MIVVSGELIKETLVPRQKRRTIQFLQNRIDIGVDKINDRCKTAADDAREHRGQALLHTLECETSEVVALKKGLSIVDATGQVTDIDASEGVCGASVTANFDY